MTTCRTNCQQAKNNLKHNKRVQERKSKGFQSLSLALGGLGIAKGHMACLLRIKLRAMLSWRAELIRIPSHPPERLMLLLSFSPKSPLPCSPWCPGNLFNASSTDPAENHLPWLCQVGFALSDQQPKVGYLCSCKTEGLLSRLLIVHSAQCSEGQRKTV